MPDQTFEAMVQVLEQVETEGREPGHPSELTLPDQSLLTLSYWREYRTLFHIGAEYAVHESNAQRIVTRMEDRLMGSDRFALSPRETLLDEGAQIAVVALDATESPDRAAREIRAGTTAGRRSGTCTRCSCSSSPAAA